MSYRGHDLDLRSPLASPPPPRDPYDPLSGSERAGHAPGNGGAARYRVQAARSGRSGTIWVDDVVLACFNAGHEIADAYSAGEMRIAHLVHAMTTVGTATDLLEQAGVNTAGLRRDTAVLVAGQPQAGLPDETRVPNTASEVKRLIADAGEEAHRRGANIIAVSDLHIALLRQDGAIPGVDLMRRHTREWRHRVGPGDTESAAHRLPVPTDVRYGALEPDRSLRRERESMMVPAAIEERLAGLEASFRSLIGELSGDRKQIVEIVRNLQRDVVAQRSEAVDLREALGQRLHDVEGALALQRRELQQAQGEITGRIETLDQGGLRTALDERLRTFEAALTTQRRELAQAQTQINAEIRTLAGALPGDASAERAALAQRLEALEGNITTQRRELAQAQAQINAEIRELADHTSTERLTRIESSLANLHTEVDGSLRSLAGLVAEGRSIELGPDIGQRLAAIEASVTAERTDLVARTTNPLMERLDTTERVLAERFGDSQRAWNAMSERLKALDQSVEAQARAVSASASESLREWRSLGERIGALERSLEAQGRVVSLSSDAMQSFSDIGERIGAIEARLRAPLPAIPSAAPDTAALVRAVEPLGGRIAAVERSLAERRQEVSEHINDAARTWRSVSDRLATLERVTTERNDNLVTAERERHALLVDLRDAVARLNSSQKDAADRLENWWLEMAGDLAVVSNRFDRLEQVVKEPTGLVRQLAEEVRRRPAGPTQAQAQAVRIAETAAQVSINGNGATSATTPRSAVAGSLVERVARSVLTDKQAGTGQGAGLGTGDLRRSVRPEKSMPYERRSHGPWSFRRWLFGID